MNYVFLPSLIFILHLVSGNLHRLPTDVKPTFYTLEILTDIERDFFSGKVFIDVIIESSVQSIKLHSSNLEIIKTNLDQQPAVYNLRPEYDIIEIYYENGTGISSGAHKIYLEYNGKLLKDQKWGFFKAEYRSYNGTILSTLAVTDFQPTHARKAFPCFDEPGLKARFKLNLILPKNGDNFTALSNTRQIKKFETSNATFYKFDVTPVMSTYLLAFAITNYTYAEDVLTIKNKTMPIRFYSFNITKDHATERNLNYVKRVLEFYSDYLCSEYPLSKLDFIDYDRNHSAATENWGLITIRKGLLQTLKGDKHFFVHFIFASLMAHELAHFYFGNLVTNFWWDDIWLQESFAVHVSNKATGLLLGESIAWTFKIHYLYGALDLEHNNKTAIVKNVNTPQEIAEHFNKITYHKGAAVLNMLELVLGDQKFKEVLREYIRLHEYNTATTADFINLVENVDKSIDLRDFLESFLYQEDSPLITVEEDSQQNVYILKQSRFDHRKNNSIINYKWTIPLSYITNLDNETHKIVWFSKELDTVILPRGNETWIKFNPGYNGYYRVLYSKDQYEKFVEHVDDLDVKDRHNIAMDSVYLFTSQLMPCDFLFKFVLRSKIAALRNGLIEPNTLIESILIMEQHLISNGLKHDEESYEILSAYLKHIFKVSERIMKRFLKKENEANDTTQVSDVIKECAGWIKTNLTSYIKQFTI